MHKNRTFNFIVETKKKSKQSPTAKNETETIFSNGNHLGIKE